MRPEQTKCVQVMPSDAQRASMATAFNGGVVLHKKKKAHQESESNVVIQRQLRLPFLFFKIPMPRFNLLKMIFIEYYFIKNKTLASNNKKIQKC